MLAVITGASRGMGKAIAKKFAAEGYNLLLTAKTKSSLEKTREEISNEFPSVEVKTFSADMSISEDIKNMSIFCLNLEVPDVLVNNAGIYKPGKCMDEPDGFMEEMMNINFFSAYHLTRLLLPHMIKKAKGHIFNICSIASLRAYEGGGGYSVSKYALNGFSQNLRHELKPHGIKVTAVFPGAVLTDSWGDFDNSSKRIMEANDIADMIVASTKLSQQAVVEEIVMRPQLGDL